MAIDTNNGFIPNYAVPEDKKRLLAILKTSQTQTVWLATDEDREGEAIAWHLMQVLKLDPSKTKRIVFHEITKKAIMNAVENPRKLNDNLVSAQQARRVLDRLVGFELSPVLWRKVKQGLSAGRVQSVAVRLIVEREQEINNFKSLSSFKTTALFQNKNSELLKAELPQKFEKYEMHINLFQAVKNLAFLLVH